MKIIVKRVMVFFVGMVIFLAGIMGTFLLLTNRISAEELTKTQMTLIESRIRHFANEHKKLPVRLIDLPPLSGDRDSDFRDGWGRELIYEQQAEGTVLLLSLGKSGKEDRSDAIIVRFTVSGVKADPVQK